jgi:Flp pilus assembly protein TadG
VGTNSKQDHRRARRPAGEFLRRFLRGGRDEGGAVAIIFAAAVVMLVPLVIGIFDIYMGTTQRNRLQDALDAAALYAARSTATTDAQVQAAGLKALNANLVTLEGVSLVSSSFTLKDGVVTASAAVTAPSLGLWPHDNLTADTTVVRASNNIEVSLILDTTGSMAGSKISSLKTAANQLVQIVVQDQQNPTYSKMAIIPYSMGVNVSSTYATAVRGSLKSGTSTTPGSQTFQFTSPSGNTNKFDASTCVTERTGAEAYTDAPPTTALLGINYPSAANNPCLTNTLLPLTSDKTALTNKINGLVAAGSTGGHIGVAWGWYMVSPKFAYLWPSISQPAAYGTEHLLKVVILMTDGEYNSPYCKGVIAQDATSGSGNTTDHINCNAPNGSAYSQSATLCTNMKKAGVIVYTVGFQVSSDASAQNLVKGCATDASHVYLPTTGSDLQIAFQAIGQDISNLRISK